MKNLEQERADHALKQCSDSERFQTDGKADVTKPMTTMVQECGLLPALAFAMEKKDAHLEVFKAFTDFLGEKSPEKYMEYIAKEDSATLRHHTAMCLKYLCYLRRFANMKEEGQ